MKPIPRPLARLAAVVLVAIVAGACVHAAVPSREQMERSTRGLEAAFGPLEALRVTWLLDTDSCRDLEYSRGLFNNGDANADCALPDESSANPFDAATSADYERTRALLRATGVSVWNLLVDYDASGAITSAVFDVAAGGFDRYSYVYDGSGVAPERNPDTILLEQIGANWWFRSEDWN